MEAMVSLKYNRLFLESQVLMRQYTLPSPTNLVFQILPVLQPHHERPVYQVACVEASQAGKVSKAYASITQALAKRPKLDDLLYTLV